MGSHFTARLHHLSRLDLPDYPSEEVLRDKLLQAVGKKNKQMETGQQETSKSVTHKKIMEMAGCLERGLLVGKNCLV